MTLSKIFLAASAAALANGCATFPATPEEPVDRVLGEGGSCSTEGTQGLIGQRATAALGGEIRQRTGADIFQWVPPDSAVTMDYRQDRVRVSYDRAMAITAITCG